MNKIFNDKVVMVTGGSFGIGGATAIAFALKGAKVIIADLIEDKEKKILNAIELNGGEAIFFKCDVSESKDIQNVIAKAVSLYGKLDFAFNNAGIEGENGRTHECSESNWDKTIGINLKGIWMCMKYQIPHMLKAGKGVIINCASVAGLNGFEGLPAYVASKHGIIGLTKTAALEYAKDGIRINAICPGVIQTAMVDRITGKKKEVEEKFIEMEPIGRMGEPGEVAEAVTWLCSDAASFVTGIAMPVDGGFSA